MLRYTCIYIYIVATICCDDQFGIVSRVLNGRDEDDVEDGRRGSGAGESGSGGPGDRGARNRPLGDACHASTKKRKVLQHPSNLQRIVEASDTSGGDFHRSNFPGWRHA